MQAAQLLAALAASVFVFDLLERVRLRRARPGRLRGVEGLSEETPAPRPSTWHAVLLLLLPGFFDPARAAQRWNTAERLRRAGYPYDTVGAFHAAAVRTFSLFLLAGGLLAGALLQAGGGLPAALGIAVLFVALGLRRPYSRLKHLAKRRAAAVRGNMLTGLAVLHALLTAGVGVQESLRRAAAVGGPFCGLLGLLVARMEVEPFTSAMDTVEGHVPDPSDVEVDLFLRAVRAFFSRSRPLLPAVQGLQPAVHREVVEATERRAALVRQRSGLFGVLAVVGLVITIIAPFLSLFT